MCSTIDANFEALREDPEMVDILRRTPLVECSDGKLRCAKDLSTLVSRSLHGSFG